MPSHGLTAGVPFQVSPTGKRSWGERGLSVALQLQNTIDPQQSATTKFVNSNGDSRSELLLHRLSRISNVRLLQFINPRQIRLLCGRGLRVTEHL
jgi:hypothetical protein